MPDNIIQYILLLAAILFCRVPYIGKFLRVFNTLLHESGHAIIALITNGEVERIDLYADTSGQALTKSQNTFLNFLVVISGYPIASIAAWALFILLSRHQFYFIIYFIIGLMLLNLVLWVRNSYGIIWLLLCITGLSSLIYFKNEILMEYVLLIICAAALSESVYSAWVVFYLSIKMPKSSGDAFLLSKMTYIPSFFWGILFFAQAIYFAWLSIIEFWRVYPINLSL
ncbi:MAG: M50 family metallopeptidase [Bacteroidia bacterium]